MEIGDLLRVIFYRPSYSSIKQDDPINDLINDPINLFDLINKIQMVVMKIMHKN